VAKLAHQYFGTPNKYTINLELSQGFTLSDLFFMKKNVLPCTSLCWSGGAVKVYGGSITYLAIIIP
jgi:hypothetical protein